MVTPKQKAILLHIKRYGVSVRPVLDQLFYDGQLNGCDKDLSALRKMELIAAQENGVPDTKDPKTKYTYYYLTRQGTRELGISASVPECRDQRQSPEVLLSFGTAPCEKNAVTDSKTRRIKQFLSRSTLKLIGRTQRDSWFSLPFIWSEISNLEHLRSQDFRGGSR